jgi:hypothetical protein
MEASVSTGFSVGPFNIAVVLQLLLLNMDQPGLYPSGRKLPIRHLELFYLATHHPRQNRKDAITAGRAYNGTRHSAEVFASTQQHQLTTAMGPMLSRTTYHPLSFSNSARSSTRERLLSLQTEACTLSKTLGNRQMIVFGTSKENCV